MSCMKDKYSIYAKKLSPLFPKSYFLDFSMTLVFPSGENTWIKTFFIKFEDNIEYIRGEAKNISILSKNLMKKIEIQVFSQTENNNDKENLENNSWEINDITFLHK